MAYSNAGLELKPKPYNSVKKKKKRCIIVDFPNYMQNIAKRNLLCLKLIYTCYSLIDGSFSFTGDVTHRARKSLDIARCPYTLMCVGTQYTFLINSMENQKCLQAY